MSTKKIVIVSSSLSQNSRTRVMCQSAAQFLAVADVDVDIIDLAHHHLLPYPRSENDDFLKELVQRFNAADGWVLATPIYNFGISGTMRDFLHYALDSDLPRYKPFVVLAAAGGPRSYMAANDLALSMIYEVFAIQVGPPVVAIKDAVIARTNTMDDDIRGRMERALAHLMGIVKIEN